MTKIKVGISLAFVILMGCFMFGFTEFMGILFNPIVNFLFVKVPVWFNLLEIIVVLIVYFAYNKAVNRQHQPDTLSRSRELLKEALAIQQNPAEYANIEELKKFEKFTRHKETTDGFKKISQSTVNAILRHFDYKTVFHINYADGTINWNPEEARILCGALQQCEMIAGSDIAYSVKHNLRKFLRQIIELDDKIFKKSGSKKALILYLQENLDIYRRKYIDCEFFFGVKFSKKKLVATM